MEKDELKDLIKKGFEQQSKGGMDPKIKAKIDEIKTELLEAIPKLAEKHDNEIPFVDLKEETGYDYIILSDIILNLIMEKKLIGFINDKGTKQLSDDILIVKKERFVDSLEIEYETGP